MLMHPVPEPAGRPVAGLGGHHGVDAGAGAVGSLELAGRRRGVGGVGVGGGAVRVGRDAYRSCPAGRRRRQHAGWWPRHSCRWPCCTGGHDVRDDGIGNVLGGVGTTHDDLDGRARRRGRQVPPRPSRCRGYRAPWRRSVPDERGFSSLWQCPFTGGCDDRGHRCLLLAPVGSVLSPPHERPTRAKETSGEVRVAEEQTFSTTPQGPPARSRLGAMLAQPDSTRPKSMTGWTSHGTSQLRVASSVFTCSMWRISRAARRARTGSCVPERERLALMTHP